MDGKKIKYTKYQEGDEYNGKKVEFAHIDKTGTERIVTEKSYEHGGREHPVSKAKTIAALNGITKIAVVAENPERQIAISDNKHVVIFQGGELWTIFPIQNPEKYFNKKAEKSTKEEVQKWLEKSDYISAIVSFFKMK